MTSPSPSHTDVSRHLAATPERAAAFAGPLAIIAAAAKGETNVDTLRAASRAAKGEER